MDSIEPGIYKHYKGGVYEVLGIARHSELLTEVVVYRSTTAGGDSTDFWVRPVEMFSERVTRTDGVFVKRFQRIEPEE